MQERIYKKAEHAIDPKKMDADALSVIQRLTAAGYEAYLVGGGVRDLLSGIQPKDFDISTSASPEEIKAVFRRQCILIGRRFRLAHVRFGKKVIEVSTFRTGDQEDSELIVRDNQWGTAEQDVIRRDYTINGMFYDPANETVIDYVGGFDDIKRRLLRCIGEPGRRFMQDPVRMLRALKFRARFGFEIDGETEDAIRKYRMEIAKSSSARILEEMFKMLESHASEPFFRLMNEYGFLDILFPVLDYYLEGPHGETVYNYLGAADSIKTDYGSHMMDRSLLVAAMVFPVLEQEIKTQFLDKESTPGLSDIMLLSSSMIKGLILEAFPHFPRRIAGGVSYILNAQFRLTPFTSKKHIRPRTFQQKEFPLALAMLRIRSLVEPGLEDTYEEWSRRYQEHRHHSEKKHHPPPSDRKRRPARRR